VGNDVASNGAVQGTEQQAGSEPHSPAQADVIEGAATVSAGTLEVAATDASPAGSDSGSDLQQLLADAGGSTGEVAEVADCTRSRFALLMTCCSSAVLMCPPAAVSLHSTRLKRVP